MSAAVITGQVVVFKLDAQRFALPLDQVERATRSVAITPLPHAPAVIAGVVDVRGSVIPVIDIRKRLGLPGRAPTLNDQLLIAGTSKRRYAALVDTILDVLVYAPGDFSVAEHVVPGLEFLKGIVRLSDGIVLIHDFEQFLSLEEERALDEVLRNA
ncbi:MAG: chemotaxis protein CheW [Verrucomicrobiaceae bacterium]|nr:chemotaxis protein CheW [Verrucomicrobiaceae bacterium]